ncbi:MAG: hypothetical protein Q9171_006888 [Xanthocarpia ochracea]
MGDLAMPTTEAALDVLHRREGLSDSVAHQYALLLLAMPAAACPLRYLSRPRRPQARFGGYDAGSGHALLD